MGWKNTLHDGIWITLFTLIVTTLIMGAIIMAPVSISLWIMVGLFLSPVVLGLVHVGLVLYDTFTTI